MGYDRLQDIDLEAHILYGDDGRALLDLSDWIAINDLDEYLLKKIIDVLWRTIM